MRPQGDRSDSPLASDGAVALLALALQSLAYENLALSKELAELKAKVEFWERAATEGWIFVTEPPHSPGT